MIVVLGIIKDIKENEVNSKDRFFFELQLALLFKNPYQAQVHIIVAKIFIIQEHVIIVGMIDRGQRPTHILGKGIPVIQVGGSHQFQFVGMAAKNSFNFVFMHKINQRG